MLDENMHGKLKKKNCLHSFLEMSDSIGAFPCTFSHDMLLNDLKITE